MKRRRSLTTEDGAQAGKLQLNREVIAEVRKFGVEVRRRRESLGLNVEALAKRTKLTANYLYTIESGIRRRGPSLAVTVMIARGFGVSIADLLGGTKRLSAAGIEAARLYEVLPKVPRDAMLQLLRAVARSRG